MKKFFNHPVFHNLAIFKMWRDWFVIPKIFIDLALIVWCFLLIRNNLDWAVIVLIFLRTLPLDFIHFACVVKKFLKMVSDADE